MMDFVVLTISFTLAILLASGLACVVLLQPKVMKWYTKKMFKMTNDIAEELGKEMSKDL